VQRLCRALTCPAATMRSRGALTRTRWLSQYVCCLILPCANSRNLAWRDTLDFTGCSQVLQPLRVVRRRFGGGSSRVESVF
jgi:hypothetical protein